MRRKGFARDTSWETRKIGGGLVFARLIAINLVTRLQLPRGGGGVGVGGGIFTVYEYYYGIFPCLMT